MGLNSLAEQLPDNVTAVCAAAQAEGLKNGIIERLAAQLIARARDCQRALKGA